MNTPTPNNDTPEDKRIEEILTNFKSKVLESTVASNEAGYKEAHQAISDLLIDAKLDVANKYLAVRAASDTEAEAIQWLDFQRTELQNLTSKGE